MDISDGQAIGQAEAASNSILAGSVEEEDGDVMCIESNGEVIPRCWECEKEVCELGLVL